MSIVLNYGLPVGLNTRIMQPARVSMSLMSITYAATAALPLEALSCSSDSREGAIRGKTGFGGRATPGRRQVLAGRHLTAKYSEINYNK
jgi:hypothetical protein